MSYTFLHVGDTKSLLPWSSCSSGRNREIVNNRGTFNISGAKKICAKKKNKAGQKNENDRRKLLFS